MDGLLIILYILLGYNANQYLRRTLLDFNTGYYIIREIVLAAFLGMFTIPLAVIVFAFKTFLSGNK